MDSNAAALFKIPAISPSPANQILPDKKDQFQELQDQGFLELLLHGRTTRNNIIWATATYSDFGQGFGKQDYIKSELLAGRSDALVAARRSRRTERTRKHGEVWTPFSVCKIMCDNAYETLRGQDWRKFITSTVVEITCGEAPFLTSRKDLGSGKYVPVPERVGILDRKLHVIGKKTASREEWLAWAFRAYESTYGYEFQGDSLLLSFGEHMVWRWQQKPTKAENRRILVILSWNIWQMDGLTGTPPFGKLANKGQCGLLRTQKEEGERRHVCSAIGRKGKFLRIWRWGKLK